MAIMDRIAERRLRQTEAAEMLGRATVRSAASTAPTGVPARAHWHQRSAAARATANTPSRSSSEPSAAIWLGSGGLSVFAIKDDTAQ